MTLLSVEHLDVELRGERGEIPLLRHISFGMDAGETLGIVGESGSGKTMSALAMLRMLPESMRVSAGRIAFDGEDVLRMGAGRLRRLRGGDVGMVFQDPSTSLNPVMSIGAQIQEAVHAHERVSAREARARAIEMLRLVGLPDPEVRISDYPHALSGGMRQRAMIAMALCHRPRLLIADEPTTALDATVQAQILDLLAHLNRELGVGMILISHNLGVVARLCRRVLVMYAGRIVEVAMTEDLFQSPRHPYTDALLTAIPRMDSDPRAPLRSISGQPPDPAESPAGCPFHPRCPVAVERCRTEDPPLRELDGMRARRSACWVAQAGGRVATASPSAEREAPLEPGAAALLQVEGLVQRFPVRTGRIGLRSWLTALDGVDLSIARGESVGLVGESGSGKSTLARAVVMVQPPVAGSIRLGGIEVARRGHDRELRRRVQMVFQDPYASLNPSMTVGHAIGEPLRIHQLAAGTAIRTRVVELLEMVGLPGQSGDRMPREFSGGQRQRVGIARALAVSPEVLICDEPVSSLDVSLQAQIANLLRDLRRRLGLSYLLIAHDLPLVRYLTERVVVLYLGQVVESGPTTEVCASPLHPYTTSLISAIPDVRPEQGRRPRILLQGEPPSLLRPPRACRFHTRCPVAQAICREEAPALVERRPGRMVACHFPGSLA